MEEFIIRILLSADAPMHDELNALISSPSSGARTEDVIAWCVHRE